MMLNMEETGKACPLANPNKVSGGVTRVYATDVRIGDNGYVRRIRFLSPFRQRDRDKRAFLSEVF